MKKYLTRTFPPSGVYPFPFEKILMKSCQQNISKTIEARASKPGEYIGIDDDLINCWINSEKKYFMSCGPL